MIYNTFQDIRLSALGFPLPAKYSRCDDDPVRHVKSGAAREESCYVRGKPETERG